MAYRKCPSCGEPYNGRRCRNCLYEPFGEVHTSYDLHREEELPRRPETPVFQRERTETRRKKGNPKSLLRLLGILWAAVMLLPGIFTILFSAVEDIGASMIEATPEPVPLPAGGILIYEDTDILVLADWDGSSPMDSDIPIYVQNFTGEDLTVCTDGVAIDGCMTEAVFFYCDVAAGTVSKTPLWLDIQVLEELGLKEARSIRMAIDITDAYYETVVDNAMAELGEPRIRELDASGTVLYDQDGFCLVYQGMDEDQFGDPRLRFYARNDSESLLELSGSGLLIDGEDSGCYLWQNFLPGTQGVFYGYIHDDLAIDADSLAEVDLFLTPDGDWNRESYLGTITFPLN